MRTVLAALVLLIQATWARPVVRNIQSTHEFDRLLQKHATETGLPVVVDFYSDSCGPCRMMAPIFKKVAADYVNKAVFVKVDTNAQYELSARFQIRSLPTFQWFMDGKTAKVETGGIGDQALRYHTDSMVRQAELENVELTLQALQEYYQQVDAAKSNVQDIYQKCIGKSLSKQCVGASANQLIRKLRKKYGKAPPTVPRFTQEDRKSKPQNTADTTQQQQGKSKTTTGKTNLHLATKQELLDELEKRLDQERDEQVEAEDADEDEPDPYFKRWTPASFPEKLVIVGGGPAGMAAAIYGARAGLSPLVIAPSMGGQLQGKGVDVENYPGIVTNVTGPAIIALMRQQAAHFGAVFEDDVVVGIDAGSSPLKLKTNSTGIIETHAVIVASGAESKWLGIPGEYQLRGAGVSSCATCDGFLYSGQNVVVVGGGDAAMEDALVLARTSKSVTVVHRRDQFRASKVLGDRVLNHASITVRWNTVLQEITAKQLESENENDNVDLDNARQVVSGVVLKNVETGEESKFDCDAVFVAIGHNPSTSFLKGVVEFDPNHPGYLQTFDGTTQTSVAGIFAAGDVADSVYRQAITSAGSGAAAALDAERYLSEHGLGNEAANLEAELLAELMQDDASRESYNVYQDAGGRVQGVKESLAGEL